MSTFAYCSDVTGLAPELWVSHSTADGSYCFAGCGNLTNISDAVAAGWA